MNRAVWLYLLLMSTFFAGATFGADKRALLVGVTVYKHSRMNEQSLRYPEEDAQAVAKLLNDAGYDVTLLRGKQATREAIEAAMQKIAKEGAADGVLLLGFFGHGVQYGSDAYFCPYDAGGARCEGCRRQSYARQGRHSDARARSGNAGFDASHAGYANTLGRWQ